MDLDPAKYPDAVAVVLSDHGRIEFLDERDPSKGYDLIRKTRILILAPAGRGVSRIEVPLSSWSELIHAFGCSYDKDGRSMRESAEDAVGSRSSAGGWGLLYSDSRVAIFDIPGAGVGDVIEYDLRIRNHQSFSIDPWIFDRGIPVLHSRFEILVPSGWELKHSYTEAGKALEMRPKIEGNPRDEHLMVFEQRDLEAIQLEPFGLSMWHLARQLSVGVAKVNGQPSFDSWDDVARWYGTLTEGFEHLPSDALAQLEIDPNEKDPAEAIFRWVRDRVRYVAIHEGVGALRPHAAQEVLRARFGDCKDMATLLVSLYRLRGIEAYPVLIGTRDRPPLDTSLPTVGAFNHMIVALKRENGWHFLDPTSKAHGFGSLPWPDQGRDVVILRGPKAELAKTPLFGPEKNREERTWTIQRSAQDGLVHLEINASGASADYWRGLWRATADATALKNELRALAGGSVAEVRALTVGEPRSGEQAEFKLRATLRQPGLMERAGDAELYPLGVYFSLFARVRDDTPRRSPIDLGAPRTMIERVALKVDKADTLSALPENAERSNTLGEYKRTTIAGDGRIAIERTLVVRSDLVAPQSIADLRSLSDQLAADSRIGVALPVLP